MPEVGIILFLTIVAPMWLFLHYSYKNKNSKGLSNEDEQMLSEIWESTRKMEERIHTLERILDNSSPDWRRQ